MSHLRHLEIVRTDISLVQGLDIRQLEDKFYQKFQCRLNPSEWGFRTTSDLIRAIPNVFKTLKPQRGVELVLLDDEYRANIGKCRHPDFVASDVLPFYSLFLATDVMIIH
jgi:hypothetical protein